jgi:hypothetical protein
MRKQQRLLVIDKDKIEALLENHKKERKRLINSGHGDKTQYADMGISIYKSILRMKVKPQSELTSEFTILERTKEDSFINCGTVGVKNNEYYNYDICVNANIKTVKRNSDGAVFVAGNGIKYKTKGSSFYIDYLWYNDSLDTISVTGRYTKNGSVSQNICSLKDLLPINETK